MLTEAQKQYKLVNKEKIREYMKKYRVLNKERLKAQTKHYRQFKLDKYAQYQRKWIAEHPNYSRAEYNRKKKYSLTSEQFNQMVFDQSGLCAICKKAFIRTPNVDHDHETNQIRGLLCTRCNFVLGYAHDNPEILESAIEYLRNPQWYQPGRRIESELEIL